MEKKKIRKHCLFPASGTLISVCILCEFRTNFPHLNGAAFVCLSLKCRILLDFQVYFEGKRAQNTSFQHNHEIVLDKSSRSTEILMEKLKPGTKYCVYVKAKTAKGYGTASDPVVLDTPSKRMRKCFVCICEPC